jgi:Immunity protein 72/Immunity protein 71
MNFMKSLFGKSQPLRPNGPAPFRQPAQRDREALFWWLKRNTSYTALADNAAMWYKFTNEFEIWLRKQDDPSEGDVQTFKYALDSQLCHEKGLKRLRLGDRSVFDLASSEGWLGLNNQSLIARRLEWVGPAEDMARLGGFPISLVERNYLADRAEAATGHFTLYQLMGYPHGSASDYLAQLTFDTCVPEPRWDVAFAPGKRAPVDGIYEMVDESGHIVGAMRYFFKGESSEEDADLEFGPHADERSDNFFWRLIWEDQRYKDGIIPEEEALYPTPAESVSTTPTRERYRCEAGHPCPREGWWLTPAGSGQRRHFSRNDVMPHLSGDYGQTIWQWEGD